MANTIHQNRFLSLQHDVDRALIKLVWTSETEKMTEGDFREQLAVVAIFAQCYQTRALIVDAREFKHAMTSETCTWRDATIIPRYNDAGVKRSAFVLGAGAKLPPTAERGTGGKDFPTQFFETEEEALKWIDEGAASAGAALNVLVQYQLKPEASIDEVKGRIGEFIGTIKDRHPGVRYTSFQRLGDERRFAHEIWVADNEALKALQAEAFFQEFSKFLGSQCVEIPNVARLSPVAWTHPLR